MIFPMFPWQQILFYQLLLNRNMRQKWEYLQKVLNCKKVCSLQFTYLATRLHPLLRYHGDHTKLEITMDTNKYVKAIYTSDVFQSIMEYIPVSN